MFRASTREAINAGMAGKPENIGPSFDKPRSFHPDGNGYNFPRSAMALQKAAEQCFGEKEALVITLFWTSRSCSLASRTQRQLCIWGEGSCSHEQRHDQAGQTRRG